MQVNELSDEFALITDSQEITSIMNSIGEDNTSEMVERLKAFNISPSDNLTAGWRKNLREIFESDFINHHNPPFIDLEEFNNSAKDKTWTKDKTYGEFLLANGFYYKNEENYASLFVLAIDGEYKAIYGCHKVCPLLTSEIELVHSHKDFDFTKRISSNNVFF
jgi:hypothetical protein